MVFKKGKKLLGSSLLILGVLTVISALAGIGIVASTAVTGTIWLVSGLVLLAGISVRAVLDNQLDPQDFQNAAVATAGLALTIGSFFIYAGKDLPGIIEGSAGWILGIAGAFMIWKGAISVMK